MKSALPPSPVAHIGEGIGGRDPEADGGEGAVALGLNVTSEQKRLAPVCYPQNHRRIIMLEFRHAVQWTLSLIHI